MKKAINTLHIAFFFTSIPVKLSQKAHIKTTTSLCEEIKFYKFRFASQIC